MVAEQKLSYPKLGFLPAKIKLGNPLECRSGSPFCSIHIFSYLAIKLAEIKKIVPSIFLKTPWKRWMGQILAFSGLFPSEFELLDLFDYDWLEPANKVQFGLIGAKLFKKVGCIFKNPVS